MPIFGTFNPINGSAQHLAALFTCEYHSLFQLWYCKGFSLHPAPSLQSPATSPNLDHIGGEAKGAWSRCDGLLPAQLTTLPLALQSEALISHGTLPKLRLEHCRVGRLTIRCQKLDALQINSSTLLNLAIQCPQLRCARTATPCSLRATAGAQKHPACRICDWLLPSWVHNSAEQSCYYTLCRCLSHPMPHYCRVLSQMTPFYRYVWDWRVSRAGLWS